ncbi:hypothetical protein M409DRAFT_28243 [Zasmidium cellare ATCC 36951]|uniref:Uncharacterized protein n=1 Tax=Zasmidium cellare ATCC 36951 TaxID=1080233 RepID=A0A6A6C2C8_ZASCE|nr:uncharacterized protein M409DRAFT_28243 [Zasmidium cellare ATCC 36951]KAF2161201.1 hypothetical protein M409DRAFT_28243 [Zasmidium cellare ATCC 36951]
MRPRAQSYHTLDGLSAGRDAVAWYWRLVAVGSSFMILGGYLMLPATFEKDPKSSLKVAEAVVGIFAVALLAAGFSFTALLCFAVRNPLFQADAVFLPALTSCALGLLTVLYDFLVFSRYTWNTPALLVTVAGALSTIVYGGLLIWTQRRIVNIKANRPSGVPPLQPPIQLTHQHRDSEATLWQEPSYYENYTRNMFPTAHRPTQQPPAGYDPNVITEEEMQRQQMLMLLLQKDQPSTPDPTQSTFHIDWQGRDDDDGAPEHGYYAPQRSAHPQTAYPGPSPLMRQMTQDLQPWDGVWRTPAAISNGMARPASREFREARRQEIERRGR